MNLTPYIPINTVIVLGAIIIAAVAVKFISNLLDKGIDAVRNRLKNNHTVSEPPRIE